MDVKNIHALLAKLNSKTTISNLLKMKALAQHIELVEEPDADEVYTQQWAMNTAPVTKLLID